MTLSMRACADPRRRSSAERRQLVTRTTVSITAAAQVVTVVRGHHIVTATSVSISKNTHGWLTIRGSTEGIRQERFQVKFSRCMCVVRQDINSLPPSIDAVYQ